MYVHTLVGMESHASGRVTPSTYNSDQLSLWPLQEGAQHRIRKGSPVSQVTLSTFVRDGDRENLNPIWKRDTGEVTNDAERRGWAGD